LKEGNKRKKANPQRKYKTLDIKKSESPLTIPQEPCLSKSPMMIEKAKSYSQEIESSLLLREVSNVNFSSQY